MCAKQIKRTWLRIPSASRSPSGGLRRTWYSMLLLGGGGFGGGSQKSPRGGLRRWPGRWRGDFRRFQAEGGEISAAAVRVGCQRRREGGFRVVSWRGEVARRRKSHGGGGSTSGGFVGWKNEQGFDVCGSVGRFRLTR